MKKTAMLTVLFSSVVLSATAGAVDKMKPGLWEMSTKSDMMKNMPKIPPAQLEQMRKMGMPVPDMQDGAIITKMCVTKEMTERDQLPQTSQHQTGCQSKNYQRSGNSYSVDIVCDGANVKGEGKVKGIFSSGESYTSIYDFKGLSHGRPLSQHIESAGKWLGANCGDVKPMGEMANKKK